MFIFNKTVTATCAREKIDNQGDVAPATVNVEQVEMGGYKETIEQQGHEQKRLHV